MKVIKHGVGNWKSNEKLITQIRNDQNISPLQFRIIDTLIRCNPNKYFPTTSTLASQFKRKPLAIKRAIKKLKELRYIKIIHVNSITDNNNTEIHVYIKPYNK